jgi:hypothetical protein
MRALWLLVLGGTLSLPAVAAGLYKTVDAQGNVTYTDRPQEPRQTALRLPPPNVSTPEARRQLDLAQQRWQQDERLEFEARMRQWAAAHGAAPVGYSRTLSPSTPRSTYSTPYYTTIPVAYTYYPTSNAGSPSQSRSPEGLRAAGVSHRAHRARH